MESTNKSHETAAPISPLQIAHWKRKQQNPTKHFSYWPDYILSHLRRLNLSLSNGATAQGGPRPSLGVPSILPGLGRLLSNFYILASLHLPPLHLPNAVWVSLWGAFLLAHWEELSWIDHHHPGVWHVLPISVYSTCRISQSVHILIFNIIILYFMAIDFMCFSI